MIGAEMNCPKCGSLVEIPGRLVANNLTAIAPPVSAGSASFSDHIRWVLAGVQRGHGADDVAIANMRAWHDAHAAQLVADAVAGQSALLDSANTRLRKMSTRVESLQEELDEAGADLMAARERAEKAEAERDDLRDTNAGNVAIIGRLETHIAALAQVVGGQVAKSFESAWRAADESKTGDMKGVARYWFEQGATAPAISTSQDATE